MYSKSDCIEKNQRKAAEHYQKAENQNLPQALFKLDVLCFKGAGIKKTRPKFLSFYKRVLN